MPSVLRDATIQPIPKGSKDPSLSANYNGIVLASSLGKVLEWSILTTLSQYLITSNLQIGFKPGFSTTLCTDCLLYTSPSPRDRQKSRMPSSA